MKLESLKYAHMGKEINTYRNPKDGNKVLEIYSLDFISDRNHTYGWLGLHLRHFRIKILLKWADKVHVPAYEVVGSAKRPNGMPCIVFANNSG